MFCFQFFFHKKVKGHSLLVYLHNNPREMLEEHLKKFVNHLPPAHDLQIFHVFSQNHTWIIALEN